jgi:DNA-directed RNA polymerase specialized sigma24 family protein
MSISIIEPSPKDSALLRLTPAHERRKSAEAIEHDCIRAAKEDGATNQQIADVIGVTEGGVRALLKRGA